MHYAYTVYSGKVMERIVFELMCYFVLGNSSTSHIEETDYYYCSHTVKLVPPTTFSLTRKEIHSNGFNRNH